MPLWDEESIRTMDANEKLIMEEENKQLKEENEKLKEQNKKLMEIAKKNYQRQIQQTLMGVCAASGCA